MTVVSTYSTGVNNLFLLRAEEEGAGGKGRRSRPSSPRSNRITIVVVGFNLSYVSAVTLGDFFRKLCDTFFRKSMCCR